MVSRIRARSRARVSSLVSTKRRMALACALGAALLVGLAGLLPALASGGTTYWVKATGSVPGAGPYDCLNPQFTTIAAAVAVAADGDTVHVCTDNYTLTTPVTVLTDITIEGDGTSDVHIWPDYSDNSIFFIGSGATTATVTVRDLSIESQDVDHACQAFYVDADSTLTLDTVDVINSYCQGEFNHGGAAVFADSGATLTVRDSSFSSNYVKEGFGGAIAAFEADVHISGSSFDFNKSSRPETSGEADFGGGAIAMLDDATAISDPGTSMLTIADSTFAHNTAEAICVGSPCDTWFGGLGGAIYAEDSDVGIAGAGFTDPQDATFFSNKAEVAGGAIWLDAQSSLDAEAALFPAALDFPDCPSFVFNWAGNTDPDLVTRGGAIYADGDVALHCAQLSANGASSPGPGATTRTTDGGAIFARGALVLDPTQTETTFEPVWFVGNAAARDGGAIAVDATATAAVGLAGDAVDPEALLFVANTADRSGGAISARQQSVASAGYVIVSHAAFYANIASFDGTGQGGGGAIHVASEVDLTVRGASWFGWPSFPDDTVPETFEAPPVLDFGWLGAAIEDGFPIGPGFSGNAAAAPAPLCEVDLMADPAITCASLGGGAILSDAAGTLALSDFDDLCPVFTGNMTTESAADPGNANVGGAIRMRDATAALDVTCGSFEGNRADQGGGIFVANGVDATISGAEFRSNFAYTAGAGLRMGNGPTSVDSSTFHLNQTSANSGGGGAIYAIGSLHVTATSFTSNTVGATGGAIVVAGALTIEGSTFSANRSGQNGGAVWASGDVTARNSTFTGNGVAVSTTDVNGYRGLSIYAGGSVSLTHVTIAHQTYTGNNDGSVLKVLGDLTLRNSLIDETSVDPRCVVTGSKTDAGGSLSTTASCPGTSKTSVQLALQPLADNGGYTETMALGPTSAAIDNAACVTTPVAVISDQRDRYRPYSDGVAASPCDSGAYEAAYTRTTSQVSETAVAVDGTVDDDVTVEGYLDMSGLYDPAGAVQFSYCYSAVSAPTWPCTTTDIGSPVAVVGAGVGDGSATVSLTDWDPAVDGDGAGYYLFHAEFISSGAHDYLDSEDTGANESFTYDVSDGGDVATTTTTRVSQSQITFGQSVRDTATVAAASGTDDPTGDVRFSYCYDASSAPTWGSCTPTDVGSAVTLAGGMVTDDATATAQSDLFTPPGTGYYLFHAEYLGDTGFEGSEDDGTDELVRVLPAPTLIDLTSGTYFASGTSIPLTAALAAPAGCLNGRVVTFKVDQTGSEGDYETTIGTGTTNASGIANASSNLTPLSSISEIEVSVESSSNCAAGVNTATIVVAGSGDAASGGGHYVNGGRINFGFTVQVKTNTKTGAVTVAGQMTWHKQGGYRVKGTVTAYSKITCPVSVTTTGSTCAQISGTASYYRWDGGARRWVLVSTGVGYRIIVADGGTATVCVKKVCSTTVRPDWFRMDIPSLTVTGESTEPIQLKGGGVSIK